MTPTITILPTADTATLINTIKKANAECKRIVLMPGTYLTMPGVNQKIPVNKNGISITGARGLAGYSSIKRPDRSIDPKHSDSNYGLFFIPSAPSAAEWASVTHWDTHSAIHPETGVKTVFQFTVLLRGAVKIENLELDCNMGNQGLPSVYPSEKIEHSAMLGFSGERFKNNAFPGKYIFVGFESVILKNIHTIRGGYSDDIWFSRGYFRPNIGSVSINNIRSSNRVNTKRATVSFSGLTQTTAISNADIFKLEAEEGSRWKGLPGEPLTPANQYSRWKLKNIKCEMLDIAAKGKAIFMEADNIETTRSTSLYQVGGLIKKAIFNMQAQPAPLNRLNALTFKNVNWIFKPYRNNKGNFIGIAPKPQYGEPCSARFINNTFKLNGSLVTDALTEQHCLIETEHLAGDGNTVTLEFSNCTYDSRFGVDAKTFIAKVHASGNWRFKKSDFGNIAVEKALLIAPAATINSAGDYISVNVP